MDWKSLFPAIIGALIVVVGWFIGHWLNSRREIRADKRKLRVTYLLEVYRKLEGASNRFQAVDNSHEADMESALADIQLLGTPRQVELAVKCGKAFAQDGEVSFDELLNSLRNSLRSELELEPLATSLMFFRIVHKAKNSQSLSRQKSR